MTTNIEIPDYFDTWVFAKTVEFLGLNGMEQKDWEGVGEIDGWDLFMQREISAAQIPVYIRHYEGQEAPGRCPFMLYIDNKSNEWDSWIIKFFSSFKKAKEFCKERKLNLVKR